MKLKAKVVDNFLFIYIGKFKEAMWTIQVEEYCLIQFVTHLDGKDHKYHCTDFQNAIKKAKQYEKDMKACLGLDKENV
jgi:hypothetical protein